MNLGALAPLALLGGALLWLAQRQRRVRAMPAG
jgi:hypothetical protein